MFDRTKKGLWWDSALRVNSGCTKVSPGCDHCWSESELKVRSKNPSEKMKAQWPGNFSGDVRLLPDNLEKILKARTPKAWAVWNDLFHESVPFDCADKVLAPFALCPEQLAIILTKRPERMAEHLNYLTGEAKPGPGSYPIQDHFSDVFMDSKYYMEKAASLEKEDKKHWVYGDGGSTPRYDKFYADVTRKIKAISWPLPNIWLGTSAEDQQRLGDRIGHLLQCPATVRFLSLEPLLGPVDLLKYFADIECGECDWLGFTDNDTPEGGLQKIYKGDDDWDDCYDEHDPDDDGLWICPKCKAWDAHMSYVPLHDPHGINPRLNWVIVGAESRGGGVGRECKVEWVRSIVAQCQAAGVPVFVKQLHIDGKLVKDLEKFPEDLRLRQVPAFSV